MRPIRTAPIVIAAALAGATAASAQPGGPCGPLESVPTPGQGQPGRMLSEVAASGDTAFAVGRWYPGGAGAFTPLLYRFNGEAWADIGLPPLGGLGTQPVLMSADMAAATGDDAWVVGYVTTGYPTNNLPLIMRWRGGEFDRIETPGLRPQTEYPYAARGGFAHDAEVISGQDVWVVGQAAGFGDAVTSSVAMALHWNGSSWQDVPTPIVANRTHRFDAVSATGPDDVWAVGTTRDIAGPFLGFICRWDGDSWNVVQHPALSIPQSQFSAVFAAGPEDVWVAGSVNYTDPLLYRWNGASFQPAPAPAAGSAVVALHGTGPDDVWALTAGATVSVFRWDGGSWSEVPNPPPPAGMIDSGRGLAVSGECEAWVVGSQMNATGFFGTFSERAAGGAPACRADWDGNNTVNSSDISAFLTAWLASLTQGDLDADYNEDNLVNSADVSAFLVAWLTAVQGGC